MTYCFVFVSLLLYDRVWLPKSLKHYKKDTSDCNGLKTTKIWTGNARDFGVTLKYIRESYIKYFNTLFSTRS